MAEIINTFNGENLFQNVCTHLLEIKKNILEGIFFDLIEHDDPEFSIKLRKNFVQFCEDEGLLSRCNFLDIFFSTMLLYFSEEFKNEDTNVVKNAKIILERQQKGDEEELFKFDEEKLVFSKMIEYPYALEWEISEERLKALKDSTKNEWLESDKITVVHASNFQYFLRMYPNGDDNEDRGKTGIFLHVRLGKEKKVEAEYTFSIKSANWNHKMNHVFEESKGYGCTLSDNPSNKFIVDEKLTVKVEGIFKFENTKSNKETQSKCERTRNFRDLWKIGYKDFTIIAGGKEIEVHKNVLASSSTVFDAMFSNSKFKEGSENRIEIIDFSFEIVEKSVQLCYHRKNVSNFSIDENAMLLKFADKYDITMIKKNLEEHLYEKITVSNVCEMVKIAGEGNALNLRMKCLDFFIICLSKKEFVPNMEFLDNEFCITAMKNTMLHKSQTF